MDETTAANQTNPIPDLSGSQVSDPASSDILAGTGLARKDSYRVAIGHGLRTGGAVGHDLHRCRTQPRKERLAEEPHSETRLGAWNLALEVALDPQYSPRVLGRVFGRCVKPPDGIDV